MYCCNLPYSAKRVEKNKQIERSSINFPKFSHPNIFSALIRNRTLTQFAKVSPSKYTRRAILPFPTNVLRYTVCINTDD